MVKDSKVSSSPESLTMVKDSKVSSSPESLTMVKDSEVFLPPVSSTHVAITGNKVVNNSANIKNYISSIVI